MEPKTTNQTAAKTSAFTLPPTIVGRTDISRLLRELETLEASSVKTKNPPAQPLKITGLLSQIVAANDYDLSDKNHRQHLSQQLTTVRDRAPAVHISFATEPSPKIIETLLGWLRSNIHPYLLLQIGLQPSIAAGCVLRTPNKIFDLSLRAYFEKQKPYLLELIKSAGAGTK